MGIIPALYTSPVIPANPNPGDVWADVSTNNIYTYAGKDTGWVLMNSAVRESPPEEDIIPKPEPEMPVSKENSEERVNEKITAFQKVLNYPEPLQRLRFEEDLSFINNPELDGSGIQYLKTTGIALINRSKTP